MTALSDKPGLTRQRSFQDLQEFQKQKIRDKEERLGTTYFHIIASYVVVDKVHPIPAPSCWHFKADMHLAKGAYFLQISSIFFVRLRWGLMNVKETHCQQDY